MAVTKRTRFEVLKRDNYTCRYCRSAENALTIDHVVPVALGGSDAPDNLVAACKDCNAGKSSVAPDAGLVEDVKEDAVRWAAAMKQALRTMKLNHKAEIKYLTEVYDAWSRYGNDRYLPADWEDAVRAWWRQGVPIEFPVDAVFIAWGKSYLNDWDRFRYTAGIVKNKIAEAHERTSALLAEDAANGS